MSVSLSDEGKSDRLFMGIPDVFTSFQWHHDSFDLPGGAVLLASSLACPHQAFSVGDSAWGLQFHPEVTETIIRDWCAWDRSTQQQSEKMVSEFSSVAETYRATSRLLLDNFLGAH